MLLIFVDILSLSEHHLYNMADTNVAHFPNNMAIWSLIALSYFSWSILRQQLEQSSTALSAVVVLACPQATARPDCSVFNSNKKQITSELVAAKPFMLFVPCFLIIFAHSYGIFLLLQICKHPVFAPKFCLAINACVCLIYEHVLAIVTLIACVYLGGS